MKLNVKKAEKNQDWYVAVKISKFHYDGNWLHNDEMI